MITVVELEDQLAASIVAEYRKPDHPMTALDRCDGCSARAVYRMHRPPTIEHWDRKGVLEFCGHHYAKHAKIMSPQGWELAAVGNNAGGVT